MCSTGLRQNISGYFLFCTWSNPGINNSRRNARAEFGTRLETRPIVQLSPVCCLFSSITRWEKRSDSFKNRTFRDFRRLFFEKFLLRRKVILAWRSKHRHWKSSCCDISSWSVISVKDKNRYSWTNIFISGWRKLSKKWWPHATAITETVTFSLRISRPD